MGRIVSTFFMSLDGVVESPQRFHFPYFDEEMGRVMTEYQATTAAYLLGRELYDQWSQYWPGNTDDDFGPWISALPKHVLSNTLTEATWENTELVSGDEDEVAAAVQRIKDDTDGDVGMSGCATTVGWLLRRGLLDELVLFVDPVLVGSGQRLFEHPDQQVGLRLVGSEVLPTGVHVLRLAPA